ncbi:adenosylcobinamide amidohydrolase [Alkalibacter mobilis]|uniref:adenosylcobinamide amidohydrolase n=1 Tax=Alkalibacter mobilis TaxID=2787712 RepID=UPI00189CBD25|nr:adenosylcobinamide amidohydrolase [Alkalibacter mobilis]MBF7097862.1 adenosylcobinamide amidohydrolase [Alkalibacter mobilis]
MQIHELSTGDKVHRYNKAIIVEFIDKRKVLSTAHLNGGFREDLKAILNFDSNPEDGSTYCQRSDTYEDDLRFIAKELNVDPDKTAAISTTVPMINVSIKSSIYEDLQVTAIVTAGIDGNAGRVGDPAYFHERKGEVVVIQPGTINIILLVDADLPNGTMTRAIVTATEAKTAALQELQARSVYSSGLATGTGTDETILICNPKSESIMKFAGKHSKLGELIGITVKEAVSEALDLYAGLTSQKQHSVLRKIERFGLGRERLADEIKKMVPESTGLEITSRISELDNDPELISIASLFVHLMDQLSWGLLSSAEVINECNILLRRVNPKSIGINTEIKADQGSLIKKMVDLFCEGLVTRASY